MSALFLWSHKFELTKGKWIFVPSDVGRQNGQTIIRRLKKKWKVPSHFAHLQEGGHVLALKAHTKSTWFIRADISNFFGTINKSRVTRIMRKYAGKYEEAREMAESSVVRHPTEGHFMLPYGYLQSPLIASICLDKSALGIYLRQLIGQQAIRVTVYMDDIVISGSPDTDGRAIMEKLEERATRSGFTLSRSKTIGPVGQITAFNLELGHQHLVVSDGKMENFREKLASCYSRHVWEGVTGYVATVNPEQARSLVSGVEASRKAA